ncbi:type IX secretion system membrane protein PorP/SprF [Panacibacter sp. KCS-6]|uniref:Type IX secretion system membrane protein PorP/SprF n=2 Tax=Limnovirga soli TaxID=2656915 RepID=A0A8J8F9W4_9BACT|nr:type IX secretion system membrane protein PorP/SprF [Limnovirga soli]
MKQNKILLVSMLLLLVASMQNGLYAQDLHFSQYFNSPLLVNPANTGFAPDVDYRVGINYRNQWASVTPNPYKTMSAWGDVQLFNDRFQSGWVGLGGALLRDVAGSGGLTSTRGFASVAYHQLLGQNSLLSGGFNVGLTNKRIDLSKLTFNSQWNKDFFDITIPSGESFAYNSVTYLDIQAGLNFAFFPTDNAYINLGASAMHLNRPRESFFNNNTLDTRIDPRFTFFVNGSFKLNDQWIVNPNIYVSKMGTAYETVAGLNAHYNLSGDGSTQVIGGLYLRLKDAFIPMIGFQLKDVSITVNYDATSSTLGTYNQTNGAYELSIIKTGLFTPGGKDVKCPTISF